MSGTTSAVSEVGTDREDPVGKAQTSNEDPLSGVSGGFEDGDSHSIVCIHGLNPDACKVCNGYVRRLIENQGNGAK